MKILSKHYGTSPNFTLLDTEKDEIFHFEDERLSRVKYGNTEHFKTCNPHIKGEVIEGFVVSIIQEYFDKEEDMKYLNINLDDNIAYDNKYYIYHHTSHAAYAYYTRPDHFITSDILSYDGWGCCTDRMFFHDKKVIDDSIFGMGYLWRSASEYLFRQDCCSGKIMGLSAYGSFNNDLFSFLKEKIVEMQKMKTMNKFTIKIEKNKLLEIIKQEIFEFFSSIKKEDISFTLQKFLEIEVLNYLKSVKNSDNLCISGGIGLNGYINQKIIESKIYKKIHIAPATSDCGLSIGSALFIANLHKEYKLKNIMYLGRKFEISKNLIDNLIVNHHNLKVKKMRYEDIYEYIAKKITEKKIVGWYQGRSESGPRALGNRSILCDPTYKDMKNFLNKRVKHREEFRPFAPSILIEHVEDWFENITEAPNMLKIASFKSGKGEEVPAVCHVDYTGRLQSVKKEDNKHFYNLINAFYNITNIPMILNTSFNDKNEPIVDSPKDAFRCFINTNIDILVLQDLVIEK